MAKRVLQFLMQTGKWKRSEVRKLLEQAKVTVDGKVVSSEHYFVNDPSSLKVNGENVKFQSEKKYLILNKPNGYTCQKGVSQSVLDLIDDKKLFPIGRLDKYTQGLLLFTNDGDFAYRVLSPEHHVEKEYVATLEKEIDSLTIRKLEQGINIRLYNELYLTKPALITQINPKTIRIIIKEGKKRQIRKMLKASGNKVLELTRIRIGKIHLGTLKIGESKYLTKEEAKQALA